MRNSTLFGVPIAGLIAALLCAVGLAITSFIVANWLTTLGDEFTRMHTASSARRASELIEREFREREQFAYALILEFREASEDRILHPRDFFRPLAGSQDLFSDVFVYDRELKELSFRVSPQYEVPMPSDLRILVPSIEREIARQDETGARRVQSWFVSGTGAKPYEPVLVSQIGQDRYFIARFPIEARLQSVLTPNQLSDVGLVLKHDSEAIYQVGGPPSEQNATRVESGVRLNPDSQETPYRLIVYASTQSAHALLHSIRMLILAGGLMLSLAVGSLVIAWTRSSRLFTSAQSKNRLIHDRSPLFYHTVGADLEIIDVNHTECQALGYEYEELIGMSLEQITSDNAHLITELTNPQQQSASFRSSLQYVTRAGEKRQVNITVLSDEDEFGKKRWLMLGQDVTDQFEAQRLSEESQIRVRSLSKVVESLEDGLIVLDSDGKIVYANPSAKRLADPRDRGLIGRGIREVFSIPTPTDPFVEIQEAASMNTLWQREYGLESDDSDRIRLSLTFSGETRREDGRKGLLILVRDLTRERLLTRQLASSQRKYQVIFDQAPTGIVVLDAMGRVQDSNAFYRTKLAQLFDAENQAEQQPFLNNRHLLKAGVREALQRLYMAEGIYLESVSLATQDGKTRYLSIKGIPEVDSRRHVRRAFLFIEDITERIELEQRQQERAISLEGEKDRALEASRLKSQFLATITHELRTPLNAIIGFSQIVARKSANVLEVRQQENLTKIEKSGKKLLRLVNDLLDISKIEAGHMEIHREVVDLVSFLEDIHRQVEPIMEKNNNVLVFDIPRNLGQIVTDPLRLQQILINLLSNAAKFTHEGQVIVSAEVMPGSTRDSADWLTISVSDTGVGIPESKRQEIFQEFTQVDGTDTRRYGGTGLGLAISRRLVELLDGSITVESEEGIGSTFILRLPMIRPTDTISEDQSLEEIASN